MSSLVRLNDPAKKCFAKLTATFATGQILPSLMLKRKLLSVAHMDACPVRKHRLKKRPFVANRFEFDVWNIIYQASNPWFNVKPNNSPGIKINVAGLALISSRPPRLFLNLKSSSSV